MNISSNEQRVLHALARGGVIRHQRDGDRIVAAECITSEGNCLAEFNLSVFARLRHRGLAESHGWRPYRI